jgi:hypothetical protein
MKIHPSPSSISARPAHDASQPRDGVWESGDPSGRDDTRCRRCHSRRASRRHSSRWSQFEGERCGRIVGRRRDTRHRGLLLGTLTLVALCARWDRHRRERSARRTPVRGTSQYVRAGSVGSTSDALNASTFTLENLVSIAPARGHHQHRDGRCHGRPLIAKGRCGGGRVERRSELLPRDRLLRATVSISRGAAALAGVESSRRAARRSPTTPGTTRPLPTTAKPAST